MTKKELKQEEKDFKNNKMKKTIKELKNFNMLTNYIDKKEYIISIEDNLNYIVDKNNTDNIETILEMKDYLYDVINIFNQILRNYNIENDKNTGICTCLVKRGRFEINNNYKFTMNCNNNYVVHANLISNVIYNEENFNKYFKIA